MTKPAVSPFRYFNSSPEVIRLVVMIYVRYPLSLRNVEDLLFERAVDQEGEILESYVTKKRDKKAALAFMKKALKRHGSPAKIVTDGLRSYPAAMRDLGKQQEMGQRLNNRVENSLLSFRRRERSMLRFRQMRSLQKFASIHAHFRNHFALERHLVDREIYKQRRSVALAQAHLSRAECPRSKPEVHRVESGSPLSDSTENSNKTVASWIPARQPFRG